VLMCVVGCWAAPADPSVSHPRALARSFANFSGRAHTPAASCIFLFIRCQRRASLSRRNFESQLATTRQERDFFDTRRRAWCFNRINVESKCKSPLSSVRRLRFWCCNLFYSLREKRYLSFASCMWASEEFSFTCAFNCAGIQFKICLRFLMGLI
jgi:hypothetical protein